MMPALHSMEPSASCLEALQIACCDEASGTVKLRCQSVESLCALDTGATAVLHSKICLRVGPELRKTSFKPSLQAMSGYLLLAKVHLQLIQRKCT
jgi:hypothetical protein